MMELGLLLNVITVLEIIVVEFISIWFISKRKHSFIVSFGLYSIITVILIAFMCVVAVKLPGYGNGSGRLMLLGFVYFIPALVNYGGDWKSRLIIAFYSFSYGLAGFAISVRISYLFPIEQFNVIVLIVQSILYCLTFPFFLNFSKTRVLPYIQKANQSQKNLLIRYTIASFILIVVYNKNMTMEVSRISKLLVYLLLIYFIILTYRLMVSYLQADDDKHEISVLVNTDSLTGLGNRSAFYEKTEQLLNQGRPFTLFYMDLDNFKSVNDSYGHIMGDCYLREFADALQKFSNYKTVFFRVSGDEFVCLTEEENLNLNEINLKIGNDIEFLGFSIGAAKFPKDGKTLKCLFDVADQNMYQHKRSKNI